MIGDDRQRADIPIAHDLCHFLCEIVWHFAASRLLASAAVARAAANMRTVIAVTRLSLAMNDRVDSAIVCDMASSSNKTPQICDNIPWEPFSCSLR